VLQYAILSIFPIIVVYAAFSDVLSMKISNKVSIVLFAAFFLLAPFVLGIKVIGWHVLTFAVVLGLTFGLFAAGLLGGGDAKLLAVIALWLGLESIGPYLFYVTIFGGALAVLFIGFRMLKLPERLKAQPWLARLHDQGQGIPYAVPLAAAALVIYPQTPWVTSLIGG
jgi:prepilin peptidase CpaA